MSVTIYTRNVNTDRRVENGYASIAFQNFKFVYWLDKLIIEALEQKPDVIGFCEIDINSKKLLEDRLTLKGYTVVSNILPQAYAPYQVPDNSFYYVVAYKSSTLKLLDSVMRWFTDTPRIPLNVETRKLDPVLLEHREVFERGSLCCLFENSQGKFI